MLKYLLDYLAVSACLCVFLQSNIAHGSERIPIQIPHEAPNIRSPFSEPIAARSVIDTEPCDTTSSLPLPWSISSKPETIIDTETCDETSTISAEPCETVTSTNIVTQEPSTVTTVEISTETDIITKTVVTISTVLSSISLNITLSQPVTNSTSSLASNGNSTSSKPWTTKSGFHGGSPITITEPNGVTIISSSGYLIIGSDTISVPQVSSATTLTTDGQTFTFLPPSSTSQSTPEATTIIEPNGSTVISSGSVIIIGSDTFTVPQVSTLSTVTTDSQTFTFSPTESSSRTFQMSEGNSGPTTFTEPNGGIVISSSGVIIIGSDTFSIPNSAITLTTDGQTFTFSPSPPNQSSQSASSSSQAGPTTITEPNGGIVISSSGIIIIGSDTFSLPSVSASSTLTTDGQTFTLLPSQTIQSSLSEAGPTTIIEPNGGTVISRSGIIIIGSDTFSVPSVTAPSTLTTDGQTFTFSPAQSIESGSSEVGPTTITEPNGGTVISSSSIIIIGSDTFSVPSVTAPFTITTDGQTFTFSPTITAGNPGNTGSNSRSVSSTNTNNLPTFTIFPTDPIVTITGPPITIGTATTGTHTSTSTVIRGVVYSGDFPELPCFLCGCWFCPPAIAGFILFGFTKPGVYPIPVPPPPGFLIFPAIIIGLDGIPTYPESEPPTSTPESSTSSCSSVTVTDCGTTLSIEEDSTGSATRTVTQITCITTSGCSLTAISSTTRTTSSEEPQSTVHGHLGDDLTNYVTEENESDDDDDTGACFLIWGDEFWDDDGWDSNEPGGVVYGFDGTPLYTVTADDGADPTCATSTISFCTNSVIYGVNTAGSTFTTTSSLNCTTKTGCQVTGATATISSISIGLSPQTTSQFTSSSSSRSTATPAQTITQASSITIQPTTTAACQPIGLRNVQANGVVTIPQGDTGITIKLPFTDVVSGTWTVTIGGGFSIDPKTLISFWQIDTGSRSIPLGNGVGGENSTIQWSNPTGETGTELEIFFEAGIEGTLSFGIQINGVVSCTPPPVSTTQSSFSTFSSSTSSCPTPVPTAPSVGGQEQDMICTESNLASRVDCLGLLPLLPVGSNGGLTASDCISGSTGTNESGQLYCLWATNRGCSVVAVFGDSDAQNQPQSRDDIAAVINNSNAFCFRICDLGPEEGSQITNKDNNVRVCIMDTDSATNC